MLGWDLEGASHFPGEHLPQWYRDGRSHYGYHCGSGPDSTTRGMHFASREKLCTFVNGERDSCLTGHGLVTLDQYSFTHRVWGQLDAVTRVLRPSGMAATIGSQSVSPLLSMSAHLASRT